MTNHRDASPGPPRRNVAIFIDMENLFGGYAGSVTNVPIGQILGEIEAVARAAGVLSEVALVRAYANWSDARLGVYRREMLEHGVEPVQVFSFGQTVKNAADIELVVEALDVAHRSPDIDVFVIVSGDGGFVPLLRKLHAMGRYTIVVTTEQSTTSKLLQTVSDRFHLVGSRSVDEPGADHSTPRDHELLELVRTVVIESTDLYDDQAGTVDTARLGQVLKAKIPGFTAKAHGYATLTKLVSAALERTVTSIQAKSDEPTTAALEPPEAGPVTDAVATDRASYRTILHTVLADPGVVAQIGDSLLFTQFRTLIARAAPNLDAGPPLFPKARMAAQYALVGTPYCLVSEEGSGLSVALRTDAVAPLPDLDEPDLGRAEVVWEVLARSTPSFRVIDPEALARTARHLVATDRTATPFAQLLDDIAEAHSDLAAGGIRSALITLHVAGVLRTSTDEPRTSTDEPLYDRVLVLADDLTTFDHVAEALRAHAEGALAELDWPAHPHALAARLPA